jgi:hypothetical protein
MHLLVIPKHRTKCTVRKSKQKSIYIIYKFGRGPHNSRDAGWRPMVYPIVAQRFTLCLKNLKRIHRELSRYFVVLSHCEICGCSIVHLKVNFAIFCWASQ